MQTEVAYRQAGATAKNLNIVRARYIFFCKSCIAFLSLGVVV